MQAEWLSPGMLLEALADGILVVDREQRVVAWNQAAENLLGWTADELLGRPCHETGLVQQDSQGASLLDPHHGLLARAIQTGQATRVPLTARLEHRRGTERMMSILVAPVLDAEGQVHGALEIIRDDHDALHQMERARDLQMNVMTGRLPHNEKVAFEVLYRPAEMVGGDFFRVQEIAPDVYGVMVADATGHGIPAALYTMLLAMLWRDFQALLYAPAGFLCKLNQQLSRMSTEWTYCTAVYGVLDLTRHSFIYGCAGHLPPILVDPEHEPVMLAAGGIPLGLFEESPYSSRRIVLQPGSMLVFATDGLTEEQNEAGDVFSEERLMETVKRQRHAPAGVLLKTLEQELAGFSGRTHFSDDVTVLVGRIHSFEG